MVRRMVPELMKPTSQIPRATYRLQLNREFTFVQATEIVPYLSALGISHCYISPCLKARPGSMHGYDIVDHNSLNPEIGSPEEFDSLVNTLHEHDMGLILDIVPNHMAIMGADNAWWLDVLENGESSAYAGFLDIEWHPLKDELDGKVLVPVLHEHYGAVLESGELKLSFQQERGQFDIFYRDHRFPIDPREFPGILQLAVGSQTAKPEDQNSDWLELQSLLTAFGHLPARNELASERIAERNRDKEILKRRLAELCARSPEISEAIMKAVDSINGTPADPASFERLHELIKAQTFRLANWRVASDDINYRRFFDTNDLAGICMENEAVFAATHRLVFDFIAAGKVDGLRLDHPDGLYDPAQYFERLKQGMLAARANSAAINVDANHEAHYVVAEKILSGTERLPSEWPVCGTTGYDFANLVNGLFVDQNSAARFERTYRNFIADEINFDDLAYRCRKLIIRVALASELNVLANHISRIALSKRRTCDFTLNNLRDALTEVVANFPVYRTYVTSVGISERDVNYIRNAIALAKWRSPAADISVFDFIADVLTTRIAEEQDPAYQKTITAFAMKFQQFTSPVMAKGLEDTAFYRYNRLVSLNDVGSDLHKFGIAVSEFHAANQERLRDWPHTMLATSTHDSKRSEDVRGRINVLSEMPGLWRLRSREWRRLNRNHRSIVNDKTAPSPNDEYRLYQTLIGAWPLQGLESDDAWKTFRERIESYMLKAIREAKRNTSWINRNAEYETAVSSFVKALLTPSPTNLFLDDFLPFQQRVARIGLWNSLGQTLLKLTCPGVPDIYQGNDLWDFSLVDPDNRRPVDYVQRQQLFESLNSLGSDPDNALNKALIRELLTNSDDGRLKLYVIWKALSLRKRYSELFQVGKYVPMAVEGSRAEHVVAYMREWEDKRILVVAPRLVEKLVEENEIFPIRPEIWQDTSILLPSNDPSRGFRNQFTGELLPVHPNQSSLAKADVSIALESFPVGLYAQI
jgi:(1->4)-alpha-D-glucan 1-alpha-D-glucosylmutase